MQFERRTEASAGVFSVRLLRPDSRLPASGLIYTVPSMAKAGLWISSSANDEMSMPPKHYFRRALRKHGDPLSKINARTAVCSDPEYADLELHSWSKIRVEGFPSLRT